jgi:hypothetical protein
VGYVELHQRSAPANLLGESVQAVATDVEIAEFLQLANAPRKILQKVVGQKQLLQVLQHPNLVRKLLDEVVVEVKLGD